LGFHRHGGPLGRSWGRRFVYSPCPGLHGAGWALVLVLNLAASLPLRVAVAASVSTFVLADAAGFLAYSHAIVPAVAAPLALGAAVGAHLGSWLGLRLRVRVLRWVVAGVLAVAGVQLVLRGLAELYG